MPNVRESIKKAPGCSVPGCKAKADYKVMLYDFYAPEGPIFCEQDFTCAYLRERHAVENEQGAKSYPEPETTEGKPFFVSAKELIEDLDSRDLVPAGQRRQYRGAYWYPYTNKQVAQGFSVYVPIDSSK